MKLPFKVICVDATYKPNDIPQSKWVVKDQIYTVREVTKILLQAGSIGYKLEELNIDDCLPYQYFSANRFRLLATDEEIEAMLEKILQEAKEEVMDLNMYYSE